MNYNNMKNKDKKILREIEIINLFIGIILTLIGVLIYITIESEEVKNILLIALVIIALIVFIKIIGKLDEKKSYDTNAINSIALVNENNEIIKEWNLSEKVSMVIGKNNKENKVDIDLSQSIYSNLIDYEHAVLNYAGGGWYIEDLCSNNGVSMEKKEDNILYKVANYSPCIIKKGDILFIGKTKLLLR